MTDNQEIQKDQDFMPENQVKKNWWHRRKKWQKVLLIILAVFIGLGVLSSLFGGNSNSTSSDNTTSTETKANDTQKKDQGNVPQEYKNALKKAESYSKTMHMSKQGIFDQLTSPYGEQFSADAANYAINNLKADFNANALEKAKSYQSTMSMSKPAIYDQLTSQFGEKFTAEEAQYAIDNLPA